MLWRLQEWAVARRWLPAASSLPSHSVLVRDGHWWQHDPTNPATSFYFTAPEGWMLFDSLVRSRGEEARICSYAIDRGWLLNTWSGLITLCADRSAAQEVSSGCGDRMAVGPRIHRIEDSFVALQRNQNNFAHFLVEVGSSLLAFEGRLAAFPRLTIGSRFGREILRRAGFRQEIAIAPPHSLLRVRRVEVMRLLPSGFLQPDLLHELAGRLRHSLGPVAPGQEVVLLLRSPDDCRRLVNWQDLVGRLSSRFPGLDVVFPGELPLAEQIRRLASARIVLASQGAHAVNLLWAERLEHYIEITANGDGYVEAVARALGARVHRFFGAPVSRPASELPYAELQFADFRFDPALLEPLLREL
jgi:capsular polysaccharide biosynthesis protein